MDCIIYAAKSTEDTGRPPEGYLLLGLAKCGGCGSTAAAMSGKVRKDGTRRRQYICEAHRKFHRDSEHRCPSAPWDAAAVDGHAMENIEALIGDAEALARPLDAGRAAERAKREAEVERARADAEAADRSAGARHRRIHGRPGRRGTSSAA
jgi:hypothetical protein